ncbi:vWA domain-containing protein [Roseimaritima sediminicola]|uniref:vWA domain-containing protein n=1 Tax=Roseimaritima sediminicola TaxID=2662066 RepID=UPI001F300121|nr:hypothetical protein [Roseimaritima sediminicola]
MSSLDPAHSAGPTPYPSTPRRAFPAWLMSVLLHVVLMTSGAILLATTRGGTEQEPDRPVGIAIVEALPDRTQYTTPPDLQVQEAVEGEANDQAAAMAAAAPPADLDAPLDLEGVLAELSETPMPGSVGTTGDALQGSDTALPGTDPLGDGGSKPTTTKVFGVSGTGSRFIYVFDRSDSMNGHSGRPLQAAKIELIKSLRTLTEQQQFQIVFYNNRSQPFVPTGSTARMFEGSEVMRKRAEDFVRNMTAFGGTEHEAALKMALRMGPDVIFFLTDARIPRLTGRQLREIRARAERAGTTIHAIEFGAEPAAPDDSFLRELAADNGGQYRYLDVRQFRADGAWDTEPQ